MKNFFSKEQKSVRIEQKIMKYYNAMDNPKIRETLDKMPKNQETLDIIEKELSGVVKDVDGVSEKDKWTRFVNSINICSPKQEGAIIDAPTELDQVPVIIENNDLE